MNPTTSRLTRLLGTASFLTLANSLEAQAQQVAQGQQVAQAQMAQAASESVPEQVLVTGSLIRGTVAVGVPVTNLGAMDFVQTGAISTSDLFRSIPEFNVNAGGGVGTVAAGRSEGGTRVNLRQLDTGSAPRNLMMVDGMRYPPQDQGLCQIEPDIIPVIAIERIDLLLDGASATYGSDAIGGVINIILRRGYDGAITQFGYKTGAGGNNQYTASQLWGRTWDGGDITLSYEWRNIQSTKGTISSKYTFDFTAFGLDNRTPLGSSMPGTISTGAPASPDNANYPAANGHNCTNCFAIPAGTGTNFPGGIGPTAPGSAAPFTWASLNIAANSGTNGTSNEFNPYTIADYSAALQFSGATVTVDQRLTSNITFYGEGMYGMRRAQIFNQATANSLSSFAVPTWNPYYPTGAPNGLRVAYNISLESPSYGAGNEVGQRYQGGFKIDLPGDWAADVFYAETRDSNWLVTTGSVNRNAVSAALGWTLPVSGANGSKPAVATFTKPANIPYLNLFCDARTIQCNSPATLGYVNNYSRSDEAFWLNEKAVKADGPLFDLPGGTVKAAFGADYTTDHYLVTSATQDTNNPTVNLQQDPQKRAVWATFAQLNIPVFSDMNAITLFRKLDFEASWRHDQYSDFGGTSNTKIGFNWSPIEDLTFRGGWGTSFRAPNFGENSAIVNAAWNGWGLPAALFTNNSTIQISCAGGAPAAGSGAEKLFKAGFACGSQPAGISFNGGAKGPNIGGWRQFVNQDGQTLKPEQSLNWAFGVDYAPTTFLRGLDVQATWYSIKITSLLVGFGNPTSTRFGDPALGFVYLVPSDLHDSSGAALCPGMDLTPTLCKPFQDMVAGALAQPNNAIGPAVQTLIYWLNDGGTMNRGWQKNTGIDYNISYDWDGGDIGAFNAGITGTYYLHVDTVTIPGAPGSAGSVVDGYHVDLPPVGGVAQNGVVQPRPRSIYRARLGWSQGQWSLTGFLNYQGHFFHTQTAPPNVNFQCLTSGGTVGGGSFPCAISNYTNVEPAYYTFDLSVGYDTGDSPANEYLRNLSIQLTVDNLMDKTPPFEYRISTGGGNPSAFDILKPLYGRIIGLRVTKNW